MMLWGWCTSAAKMSKFKDVSDAVVAAAAAAPPPPIEVKLMEGFAAISREYFVMGACGFR